MPKVSVPKALIHGLWLCHYLSGYHTGHQRRPYRHNEPSQKEKAAGMVIVQVSTKLYATFKTTIPVTITTEWLKLSNVTLHWLVLARTGFTVTSAFQCSSLPNSPVVKASTSNVGCPGFKFRQSLANNFKNSDVTSGGGKSVSTV